MPPCPSLVVYVCVFSGMTTGEPEEDPFERARKTAEFMAPPSVSPVLNVSVIVWKTSFMVDGGGLQRETRSVFLMMMK